MYLMNSDVTVPTRLGAKLVKKQETPSNYTNTNVKLTGKTDDHISAVVVKRLNLPLDATEFKSQLNVLLHRNIPSAPVQKGVERLVRHFHHHEVPLAIATNSTESQVRVHVDSKPDLFRLFHHRVTVSDPEVKNGKPSPDIYLLAAERFPDRPEPAKCLAFEDSETGVIAAKEAGMQVVMIPDQAYRRRQARRATLIIKSLLEFKPEIFGLPPFTDRKPS